MSALTTEFDAQNQPGIEPLLDLKQTNRVLNLAPVTIRKLVRQGKLSAVRLTHKLLFEQAELRRFIAAHRNTPVGK